MPVAVSTAFLGLGTLWLGELVGCALLGPEGPCRLPGFSGWWGLFLQARPMQGFPVGGGCCPYFENYTVDASILDPRLFGAAGHQMV
jgi:hypothetical protein